jgi:hypothetical protein
MRIYLAGYYNGKASAYEITDYDYFLESYHYIQTKRHTDAIRADGRTVFLDSGAFSMFTKNIPVNLDAYADFIKEHQDIIHIASNLDHIGRGGEQKSYDNQKYLEKCGVVIQPVHHARDTDDWLERYMAEGYDYIFLGGMVPESTPYLQAWLDRMFGDYICGKDGMPKIKVHGFGLTVLSLMERYPWYSVDSTSWVLTGRFGSIYVRLRSNKVIKIVISDQSPKTKDLGAHYDTLAPIVKEEVDSLFAEKGFTAEELREIYWKRDLWNIAFFKDMCDTPMKPFFRQQKGLFDA